MQTSALRDATAVSMKFPRAYLQVSALSALRFPLIEGKAQFSVSNDFSFMLQGWDKWRTSVQGL